MGRPTSVAVVDDDKDYRQLYKLWLPEECDIIEAGDGRTGLQRIDDSIDAVLLDRQMPDRSGERVAAKLR
jgi:CheY-like chemotaxis protein